jgi:hypothetical protein
MPRDAGVRVARFGHPPGNSGTAAQSGGFRTARLEWRQSGDGRMAGTILGTTNRGDPFAYPMPDGTQKDRSEEVIEGVRMLGLDGLIRTSETNLAET